MGTLSVKQNIRQGPADNLIVRDLKGRPGIRYLTPQPRHISGEGIRDIIPDSVVAFQGSADMLDLDVINAIVRVPGKVIADEDRKINAKLFANGLQNGQAISAPGVCLDFLDPAFERPTRRQGAFDLRRAVRASKRFATQAHNHPSACGVSFATANLLDRIPGRRDLLPGVRTRSHMACDSPSPIELTVG